MELERIIDKLKKIHALTQRGVDGERQAAINLLNKQLDKYGLKMSDLTSRELNEYFIRFKTAQESDLLTQIAGTYDVLTYTVSKGRRTIKELSITCKSMVYAEIMNKLDWHKQNIAKEQKKFFLSYCYKHKLFRKTGTSSIGEMSKEELQLHRDAVKMTDNLNDDVYTDKLLETKKIGTGK